MTQIYGDSFLYTSRKEVSEVSADLKNDNVLDAYCHSILFDLLFDSLMHFISASV